MPAQCLISGIKIDQRLKFLNGEIVISCELVNLSERGICRWNSIVKFSCLVGVRFGTMEPFLVCIQSIFHDVDLSEASKGKREVRVGLHSILECADSQLDISSVADR